MKKIFVTGTESFVGKELIKQLDGSYSLSGCDLSEPSDGRFSRDDIRSENVADLIPENVDVIIHLAALSTDLECRDNAYECFDVNVMGTLNMINAAEKRKGKQFIFASTEWVYDSFSDDQERTEDSVINITNLNSEYALSKLVSESNLRQKYQRGFCDTTILRFGIIYGSRKDNWSAVESIFSTVKNKDEVTVGSLKTGRCFVHVCDIANGIIKTIGLKGFNIINLEGIDLITLGDIIETSKNILKKDVTIMEVNHNDISIRRVSSEKSKIIMGWEPKIELEEGLKDLNKVL